MLKDMARRARIRAVPASTSLEQEPAPPYHKVVHNLIWASFRIDIDAIRPFVPPQLRLTKDSVGILGIYAASSGWGLAPYQRGLLGVTVSGHDIDATAEGNYNLGGIMSEPAADIVRRRYTKDIETGTARTWLDGGLVHGVAEVNCVPWLKATIQPKGPVRRLSGVDTFIGMTSRGLLRHADSYEADVADADIVSIEISDAAPPFMQAMRPLEWLFALHVERLSSAWGEPRPIGQTEDSVGFYLDLIEGTGRAAVAVTPAGTILKANARALALLGTEALRTGEKLLPQETALRIELEKARFGSRPRLTEAIILPRQGQSGIIAYVLPFDATGSGETMLVLFVDAGAPGRQDASRLLQLMGLTQAEARLATLIGGGLSVKQAAAELGISEHTARSTLKSVYDKLQIGKQAELGHLVARLQYL